MPVLTPDPRRLTRPQLFFQVAELYGARSSCPRAAVGVVTTKEWRILATGYVGAPKGMSHCLDVGCDIGPDGGCTRTVHAEANLIAWAARKGISLEGCIMFSTHSPCEACAKLIINAGISQFAYSALYRKPEGLMMLKNFLQWTGTRTEAESRWG